MIDVLERLYKDFVEQFRGKPNTRALVEALGRQLEDLYRFFIQLRDERSVSAAIGQQLDGIGDIVCLSRFEAGKLACTNESVYVLEDEVYRDYLIYKIWKNTNICTYYDILKAIRMFWDKPLYFTEDPNEPATLLWEIPADQLREDGLTIKRFPMVRAAGVGTRYLIKYDIGIVISTRAERFKYRAYLTNTYVCGTVPQRNTVAGITHEELIVGIADEPFHFMAPANGTVPYRNTAGGLMDGVLEVGENAHGYDFRSEYTGILVAGTEPQRNTSAGATADGVGIVTARDAYGFEVPEAGTVPGRNTQPGTGQGGVAISPDAQEWNYTVGETGQWDAGTYPQRNTKAKTRAGGVSVAPEGQGWNYEVQEAGVRKTGDGARPNTVGTIRKRAVGVQGEGEAFGFDTPQSGDVESKPLKREAFFADVDGEGILYTTKLCGTSLL